MIRIVIFSKLFLPSIFAVVAWFSEILFASVVITGLKMMSKKVEVI